MCPLSCSALIRAQAIGIRSSSMRRGVWERVWWAASSHPICTSCAKRISPFSSRQVAAKLCMTVPGENGTREVAVPRGLQTEPALRGRGGGGRGGGRGAGGGEAGGGGGRERGEGARRRGARSERAGGRSTPAGGGAGAARAREGAGGGGGGDTAGGGGGGGGGRAEGGRTQRAERERGPRRAKGGGRKRRRGPRGAAGRRARRRAPQTGRGGRARAPGRQAPATPGRPCSDTSVAAPPVHTHRSSLAYARARLGLPFPLSTASHPPSVAPSEVQIVTLARLARALELNQGWPVDVRTCVSG